MDDEEIREEEEAAPIMPPEEDSPEAGLFSSDDVEGILGEDEVGKDGIINMDDLDDVPLRISVQLGQANLKMEEILKLDIGSIIGIDKLAGEPLEFFIGQKLAAKGEVVVLNEKFGLRLTDIIDPEEKGQ